MPYCKASCLLKLFPPGMLILHYMDNVSGLLHSRVTLQNLHKGLHSGRMFSACTSKTMHQHKPDEHKSFIPTKVYGIWRIAYWLYIRAELIRFTVMSTSKQLENVGFPSHSFVPNTLPYLEKPLNINSFVLHCFC